MKNILFIFGTRPEAIKMAPLIKEFQKYDEIIETTVVVTGQHREMLDQVLKFFDIQCDYDLNIMKPNQSLSTLTAKLIIDLDKIIQKHKYDIIFLQGDTTTVLTAALASFYNQIPIAHLEAGLRTKNIYSPFPEEMNRLLTGHIANYHFAPTKNAVKNLHNEGIRENIHLVGNTIIDALYMGIKIIDESKELITIIKKTFEFIDFTKKVILITGHRRESFGKPFENICEALIQIAFIYPECELLYPVHLNPNVKKVVYSKLKDIRNIYLIEPVSYPMMIWLMKQVYIILTDSGGIQEEAPALGKPVLVMRDVTERQEGIKAGTALLVGTDKDKIISKITQLLDDERIYERMSKAINPYGDGKASKKIVRIIKDNIM